MLGWVEGGNLRIDYRFADLDPDLRVYTAQRRGLAVGSVMVRFLGEFRVTGARAYSPGQWDEFRRGAHGGRARSESLSGGGWRKSVGRSKPFP
jgi:hypothetical protein